MGLRYYRCSKVSSTFLASLKMNLWTPPCSLSVSLFLPPYPFPFWAFGFDTSCECVSVCVHFFFVGTWCTVKEGFVKLRLISIVSDVLCASHLCVCVCVCNGGLALIISSFSFAFFREIQEFIRSPSFALKIVFFWWQEFRRGKFFLHLIRQ